MPEQRTLRNGLTTGTCAAAVAKAAAWMLVHQQSLHEVGVKLPNEDEVWLEIEKASFSPEEAMATTIKDAGDDPDITHGAEIVARVWPGTHQGVTIIGGKGVGRVTKPGLAIAPGEAAINPVPLKMIRESVAEVLPPEVAVTVEICIPKGEELARKTFNPSLGIVGGLSVLGTTGIVRPMSEEALKDSLVLKLDQLKALGWNKAIFSPGNYSTAFSSANLPVNEAQLVVTSNYIGFMLEQAVARDFKQLVLIGHLGKLVKLAGGIFQTHSKVADARNEILAAHYFQFSQSPEAFSKIMRANTTEEALDFIDDPEFWTVFSERIKARTEQRVFGELSVEVILLSQKQGLLGCTSKAMNQLKQWKNE
ncbi:cobalt-precorrin-5B (C(1))-methyltransferase CbiD [Mangrovibacterium marinum]|uniref:Cobalt-precorrin-5B C(1)-methyltransferase n=1 Tax=Mangrovibacterium marinum TaxID=1639118 RepID=A0A2T5C3B6_9BACT|nr:cobalt-precorrin-5B (C(1))-methyltransferase CbiD [Mangrovibacterium marinum]PTN09270.1 cobalt-precorrin 5B C1-methyltransferase [Mangrovibacterium marinum]